MTTAKSFYVDWQARARALVESRDRVRQIVDALPADSRYMLKMNDKDTLKASLEWVEKAAGREAA